ncbi:hypothetical protein Hanom_Chr08g00691731 [Helianthus anomalus]
MSTMFLSILWFGVDKGFRKLHSTCFINLMVYTQAESSLMAVDVGLAANLLIVIHSGCDES